MPPTSRIRGLPHKHIGLWLVLAPAKQVPAMHRREMVADGGRSHCEDHHADPYLGCSSCSNPRQCDAQLTMLPRPCGQTVSTVRLSQHYIFSLNSDMLTDMTCTDSSDSAEPGDVPAQLSESPAVARFDPQYRKQTAPSISEYET